MFFGKKRVEEDLQRIREANLPEEKLYSNKEHSNDINLEKGDILAMILAVMSLVLPYILVFIGIMGIVVLLMKIFWS
jgi:E3 ubiquitin-protein ligase DOA10